MPNEIIAVSIPQFDEDINVYEAIQKTLKSCGFHYIDMQPEYNTESIIYRFQKEEP